MTIHEAIQKLKESGDFSACITLPGRTCVWLNYSHSFSCYNNNACYSTYECTRDDSTNRQTRQMKPYAFICSDFTSNDWEIIGYGDTNLVISRYPKMK